MTDDEFEKVRKEGNELVDQLENCVERAFAKVDKKRADKELTLEQILETSSPEDFELTDEMKEWDRMKPVGKEFGATN